MSKLHSSGLAERSLIAERDKLQAQREQVAAPANVLVLRFAPSHRSLQGIVPMPTTRMKPLKFVILDLGTKDAWSNETGWGALAAATRFTQSESETLPLPTGNCPCFLTVAVAERLLREREVRDEQAL